MAIINFLLPWILIVQVLARPQGDIVFQPDDDSNSFASRFNPFQLLPSDNSSQRFIKDSEASQVNEYGNFFQGDMVLTPEQEKYYLTDEENEEEEVDDSEGLHTRTGILNTKYRWPKDKSGKVNVPYKIDEAANFSPYERSMILLAMLDIEKYTCVRYKTRTDEPNYISIISGRGCYSTVGKVGGKQQVSLQKGGCFSRGTIMHEFIHALGYDHMQNHAERDKYVTINWDNINLAQRHNFERVDARKYSNFGTPYDYISVMHYGPKAFSKNGKETIVPKQAQFKDKIGQRKGLSPGDAQRINNMYECVMPKL